MIAPLVWAALVLVSPSQARADPGERAFQRCGGCHSLRPDDSGATGPTLYGVFGRPAGSVEGFAYSDAMQDAGRRGLVWDAATLERFLQDPEAVVPGTTMPYQGGPAGERTAVIDWLRRRR